MTRWLLCGLLLAGSAAAQESRLGSDFRREGAKLKEACSSFKKLFGCGATLFTDHPLHIAAGSLAPQNGFGAGGAFVANWTPNDTWRLGWNVDAVGSFNGSWRAGAYLTAALVRIPEPTFGPDTGSASATDVATQEVPVFQLYAESTSLKKVSYFGVGPDSHDFDRTFFGIQETVAGLRAVYPVAGPLNLSLEGEVNGRFVDIRPSTGQASPSLETRFTEASAPGLSQQPAFAQFGEGVRIRPALAGGHIRFNYSARFQQFVAPGDSRNSFRRFTADLSHEFPLYGTTRPPANEANGPDDCGTSAQDRPCPPLPTSRNLQGSFGIRLLMSESFTSGASTVPFYFQPTLGGSDLNGSPTLGSYQDYRFRAPNLFLVRGTFEHSVWGPLGVAAMADWGKASLDRFDTDHLRHSYSAGLTLRAGAFPLVYFLFSWGGNEGTHTMGRMDSSLLGSGSRPSLY